VESCCGTDIKDKSRAFHEYQLEFGYLVEGFVENRDGNCIFYLTNRDSE
jgi:hypothetical protein